MIEQLGYRLLDVSLSYSDKGFHVFFYVEGDLKPEEILKLQFLLGDDAVRCKINYLRLKRGLFPEYNIIFSHVIWRRPPDEKCLSCKLYRIFKELEGEKPPIFVTEFIIPVEKELDVRRICHDISIKDKTFMYKVETVDEKNSKLSIYSADKDTAYKRGVWFKSKVFNNKYRFTVRTVG
mgnify:CR=1 FL=1